MEFEGSGVIHRGEIWREGMGEEFVQNTIYACTKFSNNGIILKTTLFQFLCQLSLKVSKYKFYLFSWFFLLYLYIIRISGLYQFSDDHNFT